MSDFLAFFAFVMFLIVVCVIVNDKVFKIPPEIALLTFALCIGAILKLFMLDGILKPTGDIFTTISTYNIDDVLMNVLLCFMLFSGSSDLKFKSLLSNFKPILLLSLLTTVLTALVYGGLFYLVVYLLGLPISFPTCVLLGAIVSPTDPIAATGILNKLGLPDDITAIMEGESLFNDGTGVALFVFVKGIVTHSKSGGFFMVMSRELFGAIIVGLCISFLCSLVVKITKDEVHHIMISLFAVSFCYVISEVIDCSGAIASVVCGICFTTFMESFRKKGILDNKGRYESFWTTVDKIFNYVLYILIGISFVYVAKIEHILLVALAAIVINFAARYAGVIVSTLIMRKVPDGYSIPQFTTLMTWSGLKGGLCLALVMSSKVFLEQTVYENMLLVVFVTIAFTTVIQGLSVAKLYLHFEKVNNSESVI